MMICIIPSLKVYQMMEEKIEISDESFQAFHPKQIKGKHDDERIPAIQKNKDKIKNWEVKLVNNVITYYLIHFHQKKNLLKMKFII